MKIAIVTSEAYPYSKTGGLADVTGALFTEYTKMGHEVYLFVPLYRETRKSYKKDIQDTGITFEVPLGKDTKECKIFGLDVEQKMQDSGGSNRKSSHKFRGRTAGSSARVFFISNDYFFDREELYGISSSEYPDNDQRFIFFCRGVLEACKRKGISLDILHCNDWQTGIIPLYLKSVYSKDPVLRRIKSVFTIHNLGYQGIFPSRTMEITGLGMDLFNLEGIEFYGKVNLLKAGIVGADIITTVSKTYAAEILTSEFGLGLEGILRKRADVLYGILNGIDYSEWDPSVDRFLPRTYHAEDLSGKRACKKDLIKQVSLREDMGSPLYCFVGRLSLQKGIDLLIEAIPEFITLGGQVIVIGKGDELLQARLTALQRLFPERFALVIGFDESLAHLAYAGSDIFLMPSLYEPCGLGQMIAMRYGTIPVARRTGGLIDTITDSGDTPEKYFCEKIFGPIVETGFLFTGYSAALFARELRKALCIYHNQEIWQRLVSNAMLKDCSWTQSAQRYIDLYSGKNA